LYQRAKADIHGVGGARVFEGERGSRHKELQENPPEMAYAMVSV